MFLPKKKAMFIFPPEKPQMSAGGWWAGSSPAFLAGKKVSEQEFQQPHHNHLTSINVDIEHPDDGNVLIAQELSDALPAKIC